MSTTNAKSAGRPARRRVRWGALLLVSTLALVLAEVAARHLLLPPRYIGVMRYDPELGFRQVPNRSATNYDEFGAFEYRLNSDGFRGPDLPSGPKPPGTRRLLFVGDSFLNAWAVRDERLMMHVAAASCEARGRTVEAYSLCCDDYGTSQELLLLRKYGKRVQPDAVVLALYPNNDLVNNSLALAGRTSNSPGDLLRPYLQFARSEDGAREESTHYFQPLRAMLRRHSRLFTKLERRLLLAGETHAIEWLRPWPAPPTAHALLESGRPPRRSLELYREPEPGGEWETAWRSTEDLVRAFRDEVRALGARFLVLVIPSRAQVQRDAMYLEMDLKAREHAGVSLEEMLDWSLPERRLSAFCEREGIELRALLEPFRRAAAEEPAGLYVRDGHLSWRGDAVAGEVVAAWYEQTDDPLGAPTSGPVPMIPATWPASRTLDFTVSMHEAFLANGWSEWRPESADLAAGWRVGTETSLALPRVPGAWVVAGAVTADEPAPIRLRFGSPGHPPRELVLSSPGPFELRLEPPPADAAPSGPAAPVWFSLESEPADSDRDGGSRPQVVIQSIRLEAF